MQEASTLSCKKGEIPKKDFTFPLYQAKTSRWLHPWRFAPVAARSARAHQDTSARARRGLLKKPSPPPAGALSPAGSGDAAQWAAPITDRRGSGDQALNGAHWAPAPPKGGGETWLPLWGRYVPVGRCPAADRGGSRDAGAVRRLRGQGATGRERRGLGPLFP